jgi:hypothetical protein
MPSTFFVPAVGEYVQDTIGHWYRIIEVHANGWRYLVDQVYMDTTSFRFFSYGYGPIVIGRSEFKFGKE